MKNLQKELEDVSHDALVHSKTRVGLEEVKEHQGDEQLEPDDN